jgi:hypothetical protein
MTMMWAAVSLAMGLAGGPDAVGPPPSRRAQLGAGTAQRPATAPPAVIAQAPRSPDRPRARDGDAAIREELDAARREGTREAYDLFLARHPDHPLAAAARAERERLR